MSRAVGSLRYLSHNLGDDIQAYAVSQFVEPTLWVDRDRLHHGLEHATYAEPHATPPTTADLLLFGWLLHCDVWPPHDCFRPHPVAVHLATQRRVEMREHLDWWRALEPIPCRDSSTAEYFLSVGVEARFQGCVTLSLERSLDPVPGLVVVTDVVEEARPRLDFSRILEQTHHIPPPQHRNRRYRKQRTTHVLRAYQRAEMVVTSRLHVMLPCLAYGTPVLFIEPPMPSRPTNYTRFLDYLPYVEVWDGETSYDSGGRLPVNYHPEALIAGVTARLKHIQQALA